MILLGCSKGDVTEVMLYAGPARYLEIFQMAGALDRKGTAGTKVWRPDYGASEELEVCFNRTWGGRGGEQEDMYQRTLCTKQRCLAFS